MSDEDSKLLLEIREMIKMIAEGQAKLLESMDEIKLRQKKIQEQIEFNNFVLNNISARREILN